MTLITSTWKTILPIIGFIAFIAFASWIGYKILSANKMYKIAQGEYRCKYKTDSIGITFPCKVIITDEKIEIQLSKLYLMDNIVIRISDITNVGRESSFYYNKVAVATNKFTHNIITANSEELINEIQNHVKK